MRGDAAQQVVHVCGTLAHLRRVSKKLCFGDLELCAEDGGGCVELVLKADALRRVARHIRLINRSPDSHFARSGHTVECLADLRSQLKQGDVLRVTGVREEGAA